MNREIKKPQPLNNWVLQILEIKGLYNTNGKLNHFFQCAKRWAEIQHTSTSQHSSSDSSPLSKLLNSVLHFADEKELTNETVPKDIVRSDSQSASVKTNSSIGQQLQTNLEAGIYRV